MKPLNVEPDIGIAGYGCVKNFKIFFLLFFHKKNFNV